MNTWERIRSHTSIWTLLLGFTAVMQIVRQAYPDAAIFGAFTILLALESSGLLNRWKFRGIIVADWAAISMALFAGIFIYFSHRLSATLLIFLIALGLLLFAAIWRRGDEHRDLSHNQFGSAIHWALIGTALGIWEFLAMVFSEIAHEDAFPTLTVIFLPRIDQPLVKFQFLVLWIGGGLYLFEKWKNR